jgi:hypothetical protein
MAAGKSQTRHLPTLVYLKKQLTKQLLQKPNQIVKEYQMSVLNEVWVVEGLEGTTRRQQKQRLLEWKALQLAEGVKHVDIWEGGYGDFNGTWLFCMIFDNAEEFGKLTDKYSADSSTMDNATEEWQKTPVLKFRSGGLLHLAEDLA